MIDTKKEQERDELHRAIWAIADELRGAVDGWDFKNYVLGTMFYRYISENLTNYINQGEADAGNVDFDYAKMADDEAEEARESLVEEKGFFILPSELFCNVCANAAGDENLNERLEGIFRHIEESAKGSASEGQFSGLFDDFDVNSNKLGATVAKRNEKLCKLLTGVQNMNLGDVKQHDIDAFGDAYEYLMTMYASNAGKSGGEFFTPADVSELLTRLGTVGKTEINKVYDPACGSGSLLLKAEKILGRDAVRNGFYGQEINITTYNLCRINMFLHDIEFDKFDIACEDTLTAPAHWDEEPFELIVSNPPYSIKWAGDENPLLINDPRFAPAGVLAPKSKADMAFILHSLSWLAPNGTAAIVCFPGVMYRPGAEQKIRKYLIDNNYVDCVIQLPANLFYGTTIATCIMVLKKGKKDNTIHFINATNECIKVTNNSKLTPENIENIVKAYTERFEGEHFCHLASYDEVVEKEYDLSVSSYVEMPKGKAEIDIEKLNEKIEEIVLRENELRATIRKFNEEIENGGILVTLPELLSQLCPNGVPFKKLDECCELQKGNTPIQKAIPGKYPLVVTTATRKTSDSFQFTKPTVCIPLVSSRGHGVASMNEVFYQEGEFALGNILCGVTPLDDSGLSARFLHHYLNEKKDTLLVPLMKGGANVSLTVNTLRSVKVPIPPIPVQEEIVRILDSFTALTAELSAELTDRKTQYEYYRNCLIQHTEWQKKPF